MIEPEHTGDQIAREPRLVCSETRAVCLFDMMMPGPSAAAETDV